MEILDLRYIRVPHVETVDYILSEEPEMIDGYLAIDVTYLHEVSRVPVGCVIVTDTGVLSWSICAEGDQFTYKKAREVALERAKKRKKGDFIIPDSDLKAFPKSARGKVIEAISDLVYSYNKKRVTQ